MGDLYFGKIISLLAEDISVEDRNKNSAIQLLDKICSPYKSIDIDFEAFNSEYDSHTDPHPKSALGMLMVEAFAPNGLEDLHRYYFFDIDDDDKRVESYFIWVNEVYNPFRKRFDFFKE